MHRPALSARWLAPVAAIALAIACGSADPPPPSVPPAAAPTVVPETTAAADAPATCEGLARHCGGWEGCVMVRRVGEGYEGVGPNTGHRYVDGSACVDGVCNEVCDPSTGSCRRGLFEDVPAICSRNTGPSVAPFVCVLADGACMQHDVPAPTAIPMGGRS